MKPRSLLFFPVTLVLALALLLALPGRASAWSGQQHLQITRAAGKNVPDEMADFRAFSWPMAYPSVYPDLWKNDDGAEGVRHYFEPDRLRRGFDLMSLPRDLDEAMATLSLRPDEIGTAPWAIAALTRQMSEAMRTNDWMWAARTGATLAHYVGDLHMPLHATRNFNGQESGQNGVHSRIESDLIRSFFHSEMIRCEPAVYLEDPFLAALGWARDSQQLSLKWLRSDFEATRAAGRHTDTEDYYLTLWNLLEDSIVRRISVTATDISSLFYTAWVDAGRPPIPEPFEELPPYSIFSGVDIQTPETTPGQPPQTQRTYDYMILGFFLGILALVFGSVAVRALARLRRQKHSPLPPASPR
ncbi:MAG: hypothetical protein ILO10_08920 [Kiritimatiellae bacterium]|nr:hypothetical protein [Kiritimatiellia bacterium]